MSKGKLSEKDKKKIRRLSKEGYRPSALAAMFNVSTTTIHRVKNPVYYDNVLESSKEYQRNNATRIRRDLAKKRRNFMLSFSLENDADVIERLEAKANVNDYIRTLVRNDLNNEKHLK